MSVTLQNIDHGSSDWEKILKQNFDALNQDTGWVALTLIGPASTTGGSGSTPPNVRKINGRVSLLGNAKITIPSVPDVANGVKVASFPKEFAPSGGWVYGSLPVLHTGQITCHVQSDGIYVHNATPDGVYVDLGSISYIGV